MTGRGVPPEPPDWALPGWDAVADDEPAGDPRRGVATESPAPVRTGRRSGQFGVRILGVSEVTRAVRAPSARTRASTTCGSRARSAGSRSRSAGHAYFALKDERNQLQCVWFRDDRQRSAFEAQAGLRVVAHGRIDLYEPSGALQLYVDSLQPAGLGDLALRFEALKARLAAEGLFDAARKRSLPARPRTIAVVTSPTGAVWRDVCHVLARRWPLVRVVLVAAKVQGDDAPGEPRHGVSGGSSAGSTTMPPPAARDDAPALTILARGGGSLEDLWAFNDERVVRAVVAHRVPVVAGIGHEVDVTLADFAADVRAPTPSAAAELVVPGLAETPLAIRRPRTAARRRHHPAGRDGRRASSPPSVESSSALHPAARLAASRERVGLLLDRATRVIHAVEDRGMRGAVEDQFAPTLAASARAERRRVARGDVLAALAAPCGRHVRG